MTKRLLLLSLILGMGTMAAQAQETLASQTYKQRLRNQYLQNDTAQAIINLYSRRQAGGAGWIVGAGLAAVRIGTASNTTTTNGAVRRDNSGDAGMAALFALPFAGYGAGKIVHYSNSKLDHILADYAAGKPLARSLRRKLKPRFFSEPIIKYQPVKTQPAN
jgi:hypothetical protein